MVIVRSYIINFIKYKNLLKELVIRDIKIRYRRSLLGILWTLLNPLLNMLVLTTVFSTIFKSDIVNFPVYALCGSILFTFNQEATNQAMNSIIVNASLIKKIYVPKYLFPLSKVLSSFVNLIFALIALLLVVLLTGCKLHLASLLFFIPFIYILLFSIGLGFILATLAVFFRDIVHLYTIFSSLWYFLTPVFYPAKIIPEQMGWILAVNPMYYYIEYFRQISLYGTLPSLNLNIYCISFSLVTLALGLFVFYKNQDKFILYI